MEIVTAAPKPIDVGNNKGFFFRKAPKLLIEMEA